MSSASAAPLRSSVTAKHGRAKVRPKQRGRGGRGEVGEEQLPKNFILENYYITKDPGRLTLRAVFDARVFQELVTNGKSGRQQHLGVAFKSNLPCPHQTAEMNKIGKKRRDAPQILDMNQRGHRPYGTCRRDPPAKRSLNPPYARRHVENEVWAGWDLISGCPAARAYLAQKLGRHLA
jgi:hypothetical protein